MSAEFCEECRGTGICGDEGPGLKNARHEWHPCDCAIGDIHRKESRAEQRLRAAAPDLLAALIDVVAALESYVPELDSEYQLCTRARAAIAKAKGGKP